MMRFRSPITSLALGALALALAGCDRPAEERPAAEQSANAEPLSNPEVVEEPVTSIIRPDVAPDPVVDLPPEPLAVTIAFPEGSALSPAAEEQLTAVLQSEPFAQGWPILLRGHSDSSGSDAANLLASRRRAEAVAAWLTGQGVAEQRIRIIPFGEQNPLAPNAKPDGTPNEQGRQRNRRVEVIVSPDGRTKKDADEATAPREAAGQATAAQKAIERLDDADTP